jgi:hypothetical protein
VIESLIKIAGDNKTSSSVRVIAINKLSAYSSDKKITALLNNLSNDSSYNVMSAAIEGIAKTNLSLAQAKIKSLENSNDNNLVEIVADFYSKNGDESNAPFMLQFISNKDEVNYSRLNIASAYLRKQVKPSLFDTFSNKYYEIGNETDDKYIRMFCIQGLFYAKNTLEILNTNATSNDKEIINALLTRINKNGNALINL